MGCICRIFYDSFCPVYSNDEDGRSEIVICSTGTGILIGYGNLYTTS